MAERRMFAKSIINSARFLRMSATARLLYYDLGMRADDDGIVEAFTVMRTTGATDDDLRLLAAKGFIKILNDDLVSFVVDWERNNFIRKDRYVRSVYYNLLGENVGIPSDNQTTTNGIPEVNQRYTEDRLGKDRLVQDSIGEEKEEWRASAPPRPSIDYQAIIDDYNAVCTNLPACCKVSDGRRKAIKARLVTYSKEDLHTAFVKAQSSSFLCGKNNRNWVADFDFIMRDSKLPRILEGKYDDKKEGANSGYDAVAEREFCEKNGITFVE